MASYILPPEIRPFEQQFHKLQQATGDDYVTLFEAFLDFIINGFDIERKPVENWRYNKEQSKMFFELFQTYVLLLDKRIGKSGWYDMFGNLFMAITSNGSKQFRGQFFTPEHICDFMARIVIDKDGAEGSEASIGIFGNRNLVSDPTCGSGRMLLAAHNIYCENGMRGRYFVGEDIDRLCVKMTAVNLCMHGCFGEVIQHDSLGNPMDVNLGYIVNEGLLLCGLPSIRRCDDPMQLVGTRIAMNMLPKRQEQEQQTKVEPSKNQMQQLTQLTLFDFDGFEQEGNQ